jgi:hypothetical protein
MAQEDGPPKVLSPVRLALRLVASALSTWYRSPVFPKSQSQLAVFGGLLSVFGGVCRTRLELSIRPGSLLRPDFRRKIGCKKTKPVDFPAKHRQTPP